jgi:hypothetical protein
MEATPPPDNTTLRNVGLGFLVAAVAVGAFVAVSGKDDKGATCALTSTGLGLIVLSLNHGQGAATVAATAAATGVAPVACKAVIESLADDPEAPVTVNVDQTGNETLPGTDLLDTSEPPEPTGVPASQLIQCLRWQAYFLRQMCYEGRISPPSAPLQPLGT